MIPNCLIRQEMQKNGGIRRERRSPIFSKVTIALQKLKSEISYVALRVLD